MFFIFFIFEEREEITFFFFFAVPSAAVSGKGILAVGGTASFLPSLQPKKGKKRGTTLSPVCWYLCLRMPFTAVVVPMLVLLPAELF